MLFEGVLNTCMALQHGGALVTNEPIVHQQCFFAAPPLHLKGFCYNEQATGVPAGPVRS